MRGTVRDEFRAAGRYTARVSALTTEQQAREVERIAYFQKTTTSAVVRAAIHAFIHGDTDEEG
jgi:hypothetical protein